MPSLRPELFPCFLCRPEATLRSPVLRVRVRVRAGAAGIKFLATPERLSAALWGRGTPASSCLELAGEALPRSPAETPPGGEHSLCRTHRNTDVHTGHSQSFAYRRTVNGVGAAL